MKILIYGVGVIGSIYGAYLSNAGYSVFLFARGKRLKELKENGLRYYKNKKVLKANVSIIDKLKPNEYFDYIFLTVREEQVHNALKELNNNISPTIVTMVNSLENYETWEKFCGTGRILPAFPGAGGGFSNGILDASLTPSFIQPTTFGEINGKKTVRVKILKNIFKKSHIPYEIVPDMHIWQICHLGMVVPLADAYYNTENPNKVSKDKSVMFQTAKQLHNNFVKIHKMGQTISPKKLNLFRLCPAFILSKVLPIVCTSKFGDKFMFQHAMKAKEEMNELHKQFYSFLNKN